MKYRIDHHGIDPAMVAATGYGEYQPVAENTTGEGRAKNRRVDILVMFSASERSETTRSLPLP